MAFINKNYCKSFQTTLNSSTYTKLSLQECSEVIIYLASSTASDYVDIIDPNNPTVPFRVLANKDITFRGLNDSSQLSAKANTGTPIVYYRTQYFGSMTDL